VDGHGDARLVAAEVVVHGAGLDDGIEGIGFPGKEEAPVRQPFRVPAYAGDFPDPTILWSKGRYWAFATGSAGRNLQVMGSTDLRTWSEPVDPLPRLPAWVAPGHTWAPGVMEVDGRYVMYYTARDASRGVQAISVATATAPGGPFTDVSPAPLVCQTAGSIDPNPYLDPRNGRLFLIWKSDDNALGQRTRIWGQELGAGGLGFAEGTAPALLLSGSAAWQGPVVEGPTVIGNGATYYLFYGANRWDSAESGIGYATSDSLLGRYTNRSRFRPWLGSSGHARGPQGPMVFEDAAGRARMAFASWHGAVGYPNGGARVLWIGTLGFERGGAPAIGPGAVGAGDSGEEPPGRA